MWKSSKLTLILLSLGLLLLSACGVSGEGETNAAPAQPIAAAEEQEEVAAPDQAPEDPTRFHILGAESEARFVINEVLQGNPKTVIGVSNEVSGEIYFDVQDPSASEVGTILIDSGSFVTDNSFRNGAIKRFILQSDEFEFIVFEPTEIEGLPEQVGRGESVVLTITGDLTIRDVTQPTTFQTEVKTISDTRLEGYAMLLILRSDFGLTIPEVPQVAGVDDELILEFEFIAESK
jgi:polyisoprenoid-binding protein YceI